MSLSNASSIPLLSGRQIGLSSIKAPLPTTAQRRTKIVCTIGPASWSEEGLAALMDHGMNVARFNFSHGDHEGHGKVLARLRKVAAEKSRNIAVLLDTKGPEIRSGFFAGGKDKVDLAKGSTLILTSDYSHRGDSSMIACTYPNLASSVNPGQKILVADGSLVLTVLDCDEAAGTVETRVENTCSIGERKNMNLPGVEIDLPTFTEKDVDDIINFGIKNAVEFIAASFVRTGQDCKNLRALLNDNGGSKIKIISKIENLQGLQNYSEILKSTDAIMVARGDLGMEIPSEKVFLAQKMMIRGANIAGKPVITATQMLESMISNPRPTRAECSDVANAVLLSGESANGPFFKEAVEVMARTCCEAERVRNYDALNTSIANSIVRSHGRLTHGESVASSAVKATIDVDAKLILVLSETGRMAGHVGKFRPSTPILCLTPNLTSARQASGLRAGVHTIVVDDLSNMDELVEEVNTELVNSGMLKIGQKIVVIGGKLSGCKEMLKIVPVVAGQNHGHIVRNSDEFFFNPKVALTFDQK